MRTRTARRGMPAIVLLAAGLALTACGPDDASSSSDASGSSAAKGSGEASDTQAGGAAGSDGSDTATPGASSEDTPKSGSQDHKATSAPGAPPACATSKLKITAENLSHGAGSTTFQLVFQNTGGSACTLTGYPGVSFVKAHNVQLGKAAARTAGSKQAVTLIPNAHAYADVQTVNGQGGYTQAQCRLTTVPSLRVYPPNQKESYQIPWNKKECVGSDVQNLHVGPVHRNK